MRQLQQWWRGKGHDFGGDLEMMNWEERNLRLVCSSETGRNHQVSKASKHLKTDSYLSSYFPFLKRKITTWGKKSENICSNKKQPKPEISTCKGHLLCYKRHRKEIIFEDIQRIAWRTGSFYPEKKNGRRRQSWKNCQKTQEYAQTMPNREWGGAQSLKDCAAAPNTNSKEHAPHPLHSQLTGSWSTILTHCHKSTTLIPNLMSSINSVCHGIFTWPILIGDTGHRSSLCDCGTYFSSFLETGT